VPGRPRPGRLWRDAAATGADLLWRVRSNQKFPCRRRLPDGSFLSEMKVDSTDPGAGTVPVRVIEYTLKGVPGAEPVYRLITTILDAQAWMRRRPPRPRSIMSAGKPRPRCARSRCACRGGA
jgi:hypothetical protein